MCKLTRIAGPLCLVLLFTHAAASGAAIKAWGKSNGLYGDYGQVTDAPTGSDFKYVAAGFYTNLALRNDGSIVQWGQNIGTPPSGTGFVAVSCGAMHAMAVKWDGTVVGWGNNYYGQAATPNPPSGDINHWTDVACGEWHNTAMRSDGTVYGWGQDYAGCASGYPGPHQGRIVDIDAGSYHNIALREQGTVVCWGYNGHLQCIPPDDLGLCRDVAAGSDFSVAVRVDGSLQAWGLNNYGQCNVPGGSDFVAVSATGNLGLALRRDGTIASWGQNLYGERNVPGGYEYGMVAAGLTHGLALYDFSQTTVPSGTDVLAATCGGMTQRGGLEMFFSSTGGGTLSAPFSFETPDAVRQQIAGGLLEFLSLVPQATVNVQWWDISFDGTCAVAPEAVLRYDELDLLPGVAEEDLGLFHWTDGAWTLVTDGVVDPVAHTITFAPDSYSPFMLGLVPEPCSALVLLLGGLVLRRSRR
jgi:Regulator of chromosome condensation (RCC1) repeat